MSTTILRVAVADGSVQRLRRFVRAAGRRWPAVAVQLREFAQGPNGPWVGVLLRVERDSEEAEQQREAFEARLIAYLEGNQTPHYRSTYFAGELSFEDALTFD